MLRRNQAFFFLSLSLIAAGCAGTRPIQPIDAELPAAFPEHTAAQIAQHIAGSSNALHSFRAKASFSVRSPERSGRFSADIKNRQGDSLYMTISPGLGIEAARVLVTRDSIFFYDRIHNDLFYGTLEEGAGMLSIPVTADDLFRNLLGVIVPKPDVLWKVTADSTRYFLTDPSDTKTYVIDPSIWRVVQYSERTPSGELVEERVFSEFALIDDVYLPRRLSFRRPGNDSVALLYYRSLDVNPGSLSFDFRVNDSANRIPVNERSD